jgi:hypothetical protein
MPSLSTSFDFVSNAINVLLSIEYKKILISFSYIYYITIFFLLTRVLVYFGLTLINLINTKQTTFFKKNNIRSYLGIFLKFFWKNSRKKMFLKLVTVTCL